MLTVLVYRLPFLPLTSKLLVLPLLSLGGSAKGENPFLSPLSPPKGDDGGLRGGLLTCHISSSLLHRIACQSNPQFLENLTVHLA